jgi:ribosomal-protein-alanine N-acetyltransferase
MIETSAPFVMPMRRDDLDEVVEVARASFDPPWPRQVFEEELERDWAYVWVLRPTTFDPIAAFVAFWWVRDEIHVLNLATRPAWRRRGYARDLMEELLSFARGRTVRYLSLEVGASNVAALTLYESLGFESIGVRPQYYADDQDAVVMLHRCGGSTQDVTGTPRPRRGKTRAS